MSAREEEPLGCGFLRLLLLEVVAVVALLLEAARVAASAYYHEFKLPTTVS
jgi:hypothetical protein